MSDAITHIGKTLQYSAITLC